MSLGRLNGWPLKLAANTVMLPSASSRTIRRVRASQATRRPCISRVIPVRPVGILDRRDRLARGVFPPPLVGAAKQEVAALLPPQWPLHIGGAAEIGRDIDDRFRRVDDGIQCRIEPFDPLGALRKGAATA